MKTILLTVVLQLSVILTTYGQDCRQQVEKARFYLKGEGHTGDYAKAKDLLKDCSSEASQNLQALMYRDGLGVPKDEKKAFELWSIAATRGSKDAQFNLGLAYKRGQGTAQDFTQALHWLEEAASRGHARATHAIGYMHYKGSGVPKNYKKAVSWFARSEDTGALYYLARCYYYGLGVPKDEKKGFELWSSAATRGFMKAQFELGYAYKVGRGTRQDFTQALYWFEQAASQGHAKAAYAIGYMYYKGFGVPQSYEKAVLWFKRSNNSMARHFLARCYYYGFGVASDESKAIEILEDNHIGNSKVLLNYISSGKEKWKAAKRLHTSELHISKLLSEQIAEASSIEELILTPARLEGTWAGRLVSFDWSGRQIMDMQPIGMEFTKKITQWKLKGNTGKSSYYLRDQALYFDNLKLNFLPDYYESRADSLMTEDILSTQFHARTLHGRTYLVGSLETYYQRWEEPGPPMVLVLQFVGDGEPQPDITAEDIFALAEATNYEFINLYPNPFRDQLTISFGVEEGSIVRVELLDLHGKVLKSVLSPTSLSAGHYKYMLNDSMPRGLYIVRVQVNEIIHTSSVIKQ